MPRVSRPLWSLLIPMSLAAQGTQTATVAGRVTAPQGAPLVGIQIILRGSSLMGQRVLVTDGQGQFAAPLLPPGEYRLLASGPGWQARTLELRLGLDETLRPRITLVPEASATVEATADRPEGDPARLTSETHHRAEHLALLPVDRSTAQDLAFLGPGVVKGLNGPQIRGSRGRGNVYLVDGLPYADNTFGVPRIHLPFDALEETQVLTGALPAEYGDAEGGVIQSLTRSGGNAFAAEARWDASDPAWNARRPFEPKPEAKLGLDRILSVGGAAVQDRLWFFATSFTRHGGPMKALAPGAASNNGSTAYREEADDARRSLKLTWAATPDLTLVGTVLTQDKRSVANSGAGELRALNTRQEDATLVGLQARALLTPELALAARLGLKRYESLPGGFDRASGIAPLYNVQDRLFYGNANQDDRVPSRKDSDTAHLKVTWARGAHLLEGGFDLARGRVSGEGAISGFRRVFAGRETQLMPLVMGVDAATRTALPIGLIAWDSWPGGGRAEVRSGALYLQDRWNPSPRWEVQAGLRVDRFRNLDHLGREATAGHGLSPRLGLRFDPRGDGRWVAGLSFARYRVRPTDGLLNSTTLADQAAETQYAVQKAYAGRRLSFLQLSDPGLYDPGTLLSVKDPSLNLVLQPELSLVRIDETQASLTRRLAFGDRAGHLRATLVRKVWGDLVDAITGEDGIRMSPAGTPIWVTRIGNSPLARRTHRALELEGALAAPRWSVEGWLAWSRTEGNVLGEGPSRPFVQSALGNFSTWEGRAIYDPARISPFGPLPFDQPLRVRLTAARTFPTRTGQTTVALVAGYEGGSSADETRILPAATLAPGLPPQFGSTWTQFRNDRRGTVRFPGPARWDLALGHEAALGAVAGRPVLAFGKLTVQNLWNRQARTGWLVAYANATTLDAPWVPSTGAGSHASPSFWGPPRTFSLSAGLRY